MRTRPPTGFSTLEILIALTVLVLSISAVLLMQPQSSVDTQTESEALNQAQEMLEHTQALSRKDFNLVVPTSTSETVDSLVYSKRLAVTTLPDMVTKRVVATVSWEASSGRAQHVSLTTLVTNFNDASNANTCSSVLEGDWQHPRIQNTTPSLGALIGDTTGTYTITDVDAYRGYVYVTATTNAPANKTFFIFSLSPHSELSLVSSLDTTGSTVSSGAAAVTVATTQGKTYAYLASAYGANFVSCTAKANCSQLQIVDVTNPATPTVLTNYKIPPAQVAGSAGSAAGNTVFYANGYLYLGLTKTTTGPEFDIIDVHDPLHPQWVGGYSIGYSANAILTHGGVAYVTHRTTSSASIQEHVTVLDVSDPAHPTRVSGYHAPDNDGAGNSLALLGDTLYLGRTDSELTHNNEWYLLDATDPTHLSSNNLNTPQPPGVKFTSTVSGLVVRDFLAFLLTGTATKPGSLVEYTVTDPLAPSLYASLALPSASNGAALDCEGNALIVGSNDATSKGYLSVIYP